MQYSNTQRRLFYTSITIVHIHLFVIDYILRGTIIQFFKNPYYLYNWVSTFDL